jgi:hypothetical protein
MARLRDVSRRSLPDIRSMLAPRPPCIDLIDPARASLARAGASLARDADGWLGVKSRLTYRTARAW